VLYVPLVAKPGFPAFPISRLPDFLTPVSRFFAFPDGFGCILGDRQERSRKITQDVMEKYLPSSFSSEIHATVV
jgi:hypothetical protein